MNFCIVCRNSEYLHVLENGIFSAVEIVGYVFPNVMCSLVVAEMISEVFA